MDLDSRSKDQYLMRGYLYAAFTSGILVAGLMKWRCFSLFLNGMEIIIIGCLSLRHFLILGNFLRISYEA